MTTGLVRGGVLAYGKGINDVPGLTSSNPKLYRIWRHMIERAYDPKVRERYSTYEGVTVCDEWLRCSNFIEWVENQNYHTIEGKVDLDKDIIVPGNKVYCPENCVFVAHWLNAFLTDCASNRGDLPVGVTLRKDARQKRYLAQIRKRGQSRQKTLGYFHTIDEAHKCYREARYEYIMEVADNLSEKETSDVERTKEGLRLHADLARIT